MKTFKPIALLLILLAILTGFWAMVRELKQNAVNPPAPSPSASPVITPSVSVAPSAGRKISSVSRSEAPLAKSELHLIQRTESAASIQLEFEQRHQGLSFYPRRGKTQVFNRRQELLREDSWLLPTVTIVNQAKLGVDQARVFAFRGLTSDQDRLRISSPMEGGTHVIWTSPSDTARHAYVFNARGIEIVVDAQSGDILARKNRRMH